MDRFLDDFWSIFVDFGVLDTDFVDFVVTSTKIVDFGRKRYFSCFLVFLDIYGQARQILVKTGGFCQKSVGMDRPPLKQRTTHLVPAP